MSTLNNFFIINGCDFHYFRHLSHSYPNVSVSRLKNKSIRELLLNGIFEKYSFLVVCLLFCFHSLQSIHHNFLVLSLDKIFVISRHFPRARSLMLASRSWSHSYLELMINHIHDLAVPDSRVCFQSGFINRSMRC